MHSRTPPSLRLLSAHDLVYDGAGQEAEGASAMEDGRRTLSDVEAENAELRRRIVALEAGDVRPSMPSMHDGNTPYRSLFDSMLGGVAYCRMIFEGDEPVDFVYLEVNPAFEALTGLKNVAGRKVSEVIPGFRDSDPGLLQRYGRVASTGKPERFEIYVEGLRDWYEISVYSPAKAHFVAVFDVITERKRMEQSLLLFRNLIDQSSDTFEIVDPTTGRILDVNEHGCRELGYDRAEYLALHVFDLDPGIDPPRFARNVEMLRSTGSVTQEVSRKRKNGSTFPVELNLKLVRLDRDYVVAAVRNITDRKRAESEHLQFMLGVTRSSDAIFLTRPDGTITFVNPAFERLYGYARAEVLGQTPRLLKSGTQDRAFYQRFWDKLTANEVAQAEIVNRTKDGRLVYVEATANPILDELGATMGYLAIQRDITEKKAAAEELGKLEAQLRVSQKMEAIGSLAGGIAHDFNNLLSVILSYAEFALEGLREGDPLRDDLLEMKKAGDRAAALTRQLLAFSRKQVLAPVALDLNQVATGIEKMLRRIIGEDVELALELAPHLGHVLADPGQVEQVLMNLAVNARDAMPGGGRLTLRTANVVLDERAARSAGMNAGPSVRLMVTDTGCGMSEATRARVFEPFFTTKENGKGTGLGLATVYGIVKQSGGAIGVESTSEKGTSFEIHLPRALDAGAPGLRTVPPHAAAFGGTETVLVVEDEDAVRRLTERILRAEGYRVLTAANGGEALMTCESYDGEIHLALTDVVLPQMSGKAIVARLRQVRPGIKVLYMSGYAAEEIGRRGVLEPGSQLIGKPFSAAALAKRVREALDDG